MKMTEKTVKVEFIEQSKGVVATVKVEITGNVEEVVSDDVLAEAKALFNNANAYSYLKGKPKAQR